MGYVSVSSNFRYAFILFVIFEEAQPNKNMKSRKKQFAIRLSPPQTLDLLLLLLVRIHKNLEFSPRSFVRSFIRPEISRNPFITFSEAFHIFIGITSLFFSETLQLIRAFNSEENIPNAFLEKIPVLPIVAKNCPKLAILAQNAQKWRFFAFFSESFHYFFLILCS